MTRLNIIILLLFITACFAISACSPDSTINKDDILVAQINDYKLTKENFNAQLTREMEYNNDFKITANAKKEFLDTIIKKELLIQEAKNQGLDKKAAFMYAIERYWKATLIKHLMEIKNKETLKNVIVSDKEIKARYNILKLKNSTIPPLEKIEKELAKELLEEKRTKTLEDWITKLHDKAKIKINTDFINQ